jgi:hypothetical protein
MPRAGRQVASAKRMHPLDWFCNQSMIALRADTRIACERVSIGTFRRTQLP